MAKEFIPETNIGDIPENGEFQRVKDTSLPGATGESSRNNFVRDKVSDVAQTAQTLFSDHSEKLLTVVALIGFTLVFYSGNIKDWYDFWRYVAFLGVILFFFVLLQIISYVVRKYSHNNTSKGK